MVGGIYEHFRLQYAVVVLNTAYVILGVHEQMNKLVRNNIKGELSIWNKESRTVPVVMQGHTYGTHKVHLPAQTCGSMFIDLDLCYYVCLLTAF